MPKRKREIGRQKQKKPKKHFCNLHGVDVVISAPKKQKSIFSMVAFCEDGVTSNCKRHNFFQSILPPLPSPIGPKVEVCDSGVIVPKLTTAIFNSFKLRYNDEYLNKDFDIMKYRLMHYGDFGGLDNGELHRQRENDGDDDNGDKVKCLKNRDVAGDDEEEKEEEEVTSDNDNNNGRKHPSTPDVSPSRTNDENNDDDDDDNDATIITTTAKGRRRGRQGRYPLPHRLLTIDKFSIVGRLLCDEDGRYRLIDQNEPRKFYWNRNGNVKFAPVQGPVYLYVSMQHNPSGANFPLNVKLTPPSQ